MRCLYTNQTLSLSFKDIIIIFLFLNKMSSYKSFNSSYYPSNKNNKKSRASAQGGNSTYSQSFTSNQYSTDSIRIIKRNLVYVINLDPKIADKDILTKKEYFGQYGKITKILVNLNKAYNASNSASGPSYSAYINYSTNQEAALAILSVDSCILNNKMIKAAFGTTKYCSYYLKKTTCPIKDCVYMHSVSDKNDIISKESADFYVDQHKLAVKISEIGSEKMRDMLYKLRHEESILPNPYTIYSKRSLAPLLRICNEEEKENKTKGTPCNINSNTIVSEVPKQSLKEYLNGSKEKDNEAQYEGNSVSPGKDKTNSPRKKEKHYTNEDSNSKENSNNKYEYRKHSVDENKEYDSASKDNYYKDEGDIYKGSDNEDKEDNMSRDARALSEENIDRSGKQGSSNKGVDDNLYLSAHNSYFSNLKPNKRQRFFNIIERKNKSRFDFSPDIADSTSVCHKASADEKLLQNYYLRFSFSSSFNSTEKAKIEEKYYKMLTSSDENTQDRSN